MLPYNAKDLAAAFRTVRRNTIQIAQDIPEEQYSFVAAPGTTAVANVLAHVAISPRFQARAHHKKLTSFDGVDFAAIMAEFTAEETRPRTKAEIVALLTSEGEQFASWIETLSDDFLGERVTMPPGAEPRSKTRFEMLLGIKEHEMHHRGQLMLIERLLGITPHLTRQRQERFAARR